MKFEKPNEKTIAQMTLESLRALISALETKRAEVVAPLDEQINYYKKLLQTKEHSSAETAS
jgi:hypothetical protein